MTNNNTPRLLPQLQPGSSSSSSASATSPWTFCYSHSRHTRSSDSGKAHQHPLKTHFIPYTPHSPNQVISRSPPDVAQDSPLVREPLDTFPSVLETPSPPSHHETSKRRNRRNGEEKKKERSKRRRGESHYKRKVEKPRGPPAWLLKHTHTQTSIHPPLPPVASSTAHQLPAVPGPSPIIVPTSTLTSPIVCTTGPVILPSPSYPVDPTTSLPDEMGMTPLWMARPALPLSSHLLGEGATISSGSLPFNPFIPGNGGYALSRRSSEPALALNCMADPLPTGYSMPANPSEVVPLTSYGDSLAFTFPRSSQDSVSSSSSVGTGIDNGINKTYTDVLSYQLPVPFFEPRPPQITDHHPPLTMRSLEPNFERYPGGKYLKYS